MPRRSGRTTGARSRTRSSYPFDDEFYFFEPDPDTGLSSDAVSGAYLESKRRRRTDLRVPFKYRSAAGSTTASFAPEAPLFPTGPALYRGLEKARALRGAPRTRLEQAAKVPLFGCRDCGDCSLPEIAYVCPESQCAKNQRNGPCGGTRESLCEVYDTECIWSQAYERLKAYGEEESMLDGADARADRADVRRRSREQVARARAGLQRLGVGPGDRVVAYLPNIPETLVAFLATASLGAIWATCAPEFGARSVLDRLGQLEPKLLLAVAGYRWGDKLVDRREQVAAIRAGLPTLEHVVHVPYVGGDDDALPDTLGWDELLAERGPLAFDPVPFDHPLYVLFSSGTTGLPKAIVHGHGGILLEHLKNHGFSWDLQPGDRLLWFTTTAWMMWNALVSTLLLRASIVMIDGNPAYPDLSFQWRLAEETRATLHGRSAPRSLMACRKAGLEPGRELRPLVDPRRRRGRLAAAARGLRLGLRAARPRRLLDQRRQRRHRRLHRARPGLPLAAGLCRRDGGQAVSASTWLRSTPTGTRSSASSASS